MMASLNTSMAALFEAGARILDSPMHESTPPEAGKTPITPVQAADLAAAVNGGIGEERRGGKPSQGLPVSFVNIK